MTIDQSGDFWRGSEGSDLHPFLIDLAAEEGACRIDRFELARCACGSLEFSLEGDDEEGCAKRTCVSCHVDRFVCDSDVYWSEATPEPLTCHGCGGATFNVGVGLSLTKRATDVLWVTVGQRCVACGIMGSFVDWKIAYSPSIHLLEQV
jgi:hypothetical protein